MQPGRRARRTAHGKTQKTGLRPVLPCFRYGPLLKAYGSIIDVNAPAPTAAIMATRTLMDFEGLTDTTGQPLQRLRLIDSMSFVPPSQLPVNETAGTSSNASEIFVPVRLAAAGVTPTKSHAIWWCEALTSQTA